MTKLPPLTQDLRLPDSALKEPAPRWLKTVVTGFYASLIICLAVAGLDGAMWYRTKNSVEKQRAELADTKKAIATLRAEVDTGELTQRLKSSLTEFQNARPLAINPLVFTLRAAQKANDAIQDRYEESRKVNQKAPAPVPLNFRGLDMTWKPKERSWAFALTMNSAPEGQSLLSKELSVPPSSIGKSWGIEIKGTTGESRLNYVFFPSTQ